LTPDFVEMKSTRTSPMHVIVPADFIYSVE
jgi:hypothetical protein